MKTLRRFLKWLFKFDFGLSQEELDFLDSEGGLK